ncbi:uncharacterized protein LOC126379395 [Pectinophora gossypiella]|uniref:uncharacterized protein LOC126379395 n=1 Tax=Pectinophora gossypiella TaxID=13191 RepID=UPI00214F4405|nr:uncharacterized protein LOC126379395 [Pectinophora gossypiella]
MARGVIISATLLLLIAEVTPQFYDFFNFPQIPQNPSTKRILNEYTTRRTTKIEATRNSETQVTWTNTTVHFSYDGIERDDNRPTTKEKRRKQTLGIPTLAPIFGFNYQTTTQKPIRKVNKNNSSRRNNSSNTRIESSGVRGSTTKRNQKNDTKLTNTRISETSNNKRFQLSYDVDVSKDPLNNGYYEKPSNNYADDYLTTTTRSHNNKRYNSDNSYYNSYETTRPNNNYYTTNPFLNRPGVKPAVIEVGPAITNKPVTKRPSYFNKETERPSYSRPETERPAFKPQTNKPVTLRPYIVNPIPTDAGALVYPQEDEAPQVIRGPDEDYMSDAEKRRHIEIAERMCDKYKSLSTRQLQAIPLLPSPEPVQVNVSQCTPTTIPLVVGGKVVTINEFPHMALLGWRKIDIEGYSWKCGGSLISDQYILTAAHCSYQERDNTVVSGPPRVVQLGSSYLDDPGALVVRVSSVVRHPKYKFPRSYYDIALLKLVQPVTFSEVIRPACLGVPPAVGESIIATGWGRTELGGDQSLELRSVSLPVWDMEKCHDVLGTSRKMPQGATSESQLCAGEMKGGKDTCQGDSGGPAQIQDGCAWRVVAVTSLGRSCGAANTPGLYALVHRAFISAQIFSNGNKNQNRRSDSETTRNYRDSQQNYNNQRTETTTQSYNNNPRRDYGGNRQENDYGSHKDNRRTESVESDYNNPESDYSRRNVNTGYQNDNRGTVYDSNPSYSNNDRQSDSNRNTNKYESGYNNQQSNYGNHKDENTYSNINNRKPNDYSGNNRQQSDYSNSNRQQTDYSGNNRQQSDYSSSNRQQTDYSGNNREQSDYGRQDYYSNGKRETESDYTGYNRQQINRRQSDDRFEDGRVWWT